MKNKISKILIILGIGLIVCALVLFAYNKYEDYSMGKQSKATLEKIQEYIQEEKDNPEDLQNIYSQDMKELMIDGYEYIGFIAIEDIGIELPVMSTLTQAQLDIAPCRYTGSIVTSDIIIGAHNATNHFGKFNQIRIGAKVVFTDMNGISYTYQVEDIETLSQYDIEEMVSSGYDLTLFTCTFDAQSRITLRCSRVYNS